MVIGEFDFCKGIFVVIFFGIMFVCFVFGFVVGELIKVLFVVVGIGLFWIGLLVLCFVMFGGLLINVVWCLILIICNRSVG